MNFFISTGVKSVVSPFIVTNTSHCDMRDAKGPCCNTFLPTPEGMRVCQPDQIQPTIPNTINVTVVNPPVNNTVNWAGSTVPFSVSHSNSSPFTPTIPSQFIPQHIPQQVVNDPHITSSDQLPVVPVAGVTLRPVKISNLHGISSSSTVLEARIAAAKYLKTEVQKVFFAKARVYNPTGANDELPISDYGMNASDLFFYHSIPIEQTLIPNPVPGLIVPKVFKYEDLTIPYGSRYLGPHVCSEAYQYTDFLYCQHPKGDIDEMHLPIGTGSLSKNWVGRHPHGLFDIVIKVKYDKGDHIPVSIETAAVGATIPDCGKYGPSVYIYR